MELSDIYFEVMRAFVVIAILVGVRYIIPWVKEHTSLAKNDLLSSIVTAAVQYAEQIYKGSAGSGAEKKAIVTEFLKEQLAEKNISISDEQLSALIESAVYAMNAAKQAG